MNFGVKVICFRNDNGKKTLNSAKHINDETHFWQLNPKFILFAIAFAWQSYFIITLNTHRCAPLFMLCIRAGTLSTLEMTQTILYSECAYRKTFCMFLVKLQNDSKYNNNYGIVERTITKTWFRCVFFLFFLSCKEVQTLVYMYGVNLVDDFFLLCFHTYMCE